MKSKYLLTVLAILILVACGGGSGGGRGDIGGHGNPKCPPGDAC